MKYGIFSLKEVLGVNPENEGKTVLIRMIDPCDRDRTDKEEYKLQHESKFHDILTIYVDDITDNMMEILKDEPDEYVLFSEEQAISIIRFFEKHATADTILIHCLAGISRSAGVAIGLARFLGAKEMEERIRTSGRHRPNETIIERITFVLENGIHLKRE